MITSSKCRPRNSAGRLWVTVKQYQIWSVAFATRRLSRHLHRLRRNSMNSPPAGHRCQVSLATLALDKGIGQSQSAKRLEARCWGEVYENTVGRRGGPDRSTPPPRTGRERTLRRRYAVRFGGISSGTLCHAAWATCSKRGEPCSVKRSPGVASWLPRPVLPSTDRAPNTYPSG